MTSPAAISERTSALLISKGGRMLVLTTLLNLAACSSNSADSPAVDVPPSPPSEIAIVAAAKQVASEAKLTGPLEISAARQTNIGPGRYFVCMRQADPAIPHRQPYSIFFNNDAYAASRQSVIMEACETQVYAPIIEPSPPPPPPKARPRKR